MLLCEHNIEVYCRDEMEMHVSGKRGGGRGGNHAFAAPGERIRDSTSMHNTLCWRFVQLWKIINKLIISKQDFFVALGSSTVHDFCSWDTIKTTKLFTPAPPHCRFLAEMDNERGRQRGLPFLGEPIGNAFVDL